jgi:3-methylcrotonyl-CoA carboxylase beta subunit
MEGPGRRPEARAGRDGHRAAERRRERRPGGVRGAPPARVQLNQQAPDDDSLLARVHRDPEFQLNRSAYEALIARLHERRRKALAGGPPKAREKHLARNKILPRDRVEVLLDPGSPFLELGMLAGEGQYDGVPPGASIITGIGLVQGRPCMIIANDATVKGGTYYGMTCKKHVRAQQIAWAHRLPCITLVDSGGAFLPDMANIFPDVGQFGSIFNNQVRMSAEGIHQIAVVLGPCTAGGAYIPALCDEIVIVKEQGFMYLGGPELTFAATGETVDAESLGGAQMHCSLSAASPTTSPTTTATRWR